MLRSLMVTVVFLLAGCATTDPASAPTSPATRATTGTPATETTTAPTEATTAPTTPAAEPVSVDYGVDGVAVSKPADLSLLTGAPDDFVAFVGELAEAANQAGESCPDAFHGITVLKIRDDFASGAVNDCGGYAAIWHRASGEWTEILGTQEAWRCTELDEYDVPHALVDRCV